MKRLLTILLFFAVLTLIITWPLVLHLNSLIIDRVDGLLIDWYLNWDIHALTSGVSGVLNFYNANIFYPYKMSLAYSDFMLPQALIAAPFVLLFREPLLAYNLNFLAGFILTGIAMYYLDFELAKNNRLALFASLLFTFGVLRLSYMPHLQLFNFWPVILATLYLIQGRRKLFILFFLLSSLTTALFMYFLLTEILIFFLLNTINRKNLALDTFIAGILTLPFLLPYYLVSKSFNYVRPIRDTIHFSLRFQDLFNVGSQSRLSLLFGKFTDGATGFPGISLIAASVFALLKPGKKSDRFSRAFILISLVSFIFAFGPFLHIYTNTVHVGPIPGIPLPYIAPYYLVPGFSGFRTPSRWIILAAFALTLYLSMVLKNKITNGVILLFSVVTLLEINFPIKYQTVPPVKNFPEVQYWLSRNYSRESLIQFPIYGWWNNPGVDTETLREYYSTIHWHPMYNGYSGFSPKIWEEKVQYLQKNFPSDESIGYLRSQGIKMVLVPADWEGRLSGFSELVPLASFPDTRVYALR